MTTTFRSPWCGRAMIARYLRDSQDERKAAIQAHAQAKAENPAAKRIDVQRLNNRWIANVFFEDGGSRSYTVLPNKEEA